MTKAIDLQDDGRRLYTALFTRGPMFVFEQFIDHSLVSAVREANKYAREKLAPKLSFSKYLYPPTEIRIRVFDSTEPSNHPDVVAALEALMNCNADNAQESYERYWRVVAAITKAPVYDSKPQKEDKKWLSKPTS